MNSIFHGKNARRITAISVVMALVLFILLRRQNEQELRLSDGSSVKLLVGCPGTPLRHFEGNLFQKAVFQMFGTKLPWKYRGYENVYRPADSNCFCVVLIRNLTSRNQPWNPSVILTIRGGDGDPVSANGEKQVNFAVRLVDGQPVVTAEEICYQFSSANITNISSLVFDCGNTMVKPAHFEIRKNILCH